MKPIKTPAEHQMALAELRALWDIAVPGQASGDRFETLAATIKRYEQRHYPIPKPRRPRVAALTR
jgi:antitoxin component HigA of HigAB toxin-antitoxin module